MMTMQNPVPFAENNHNNVGGNSSMNMMQQVFHYEGAQVRTILIDGQPWFVARDVCNVLEIGNPTQALERLDQDEKRTMTASHLTLISNESQNKARFYTLVNEPGLYSLILGSRKPEAKAFKRWITHEVLPSIRQTGAYQLPTFEGRKLPRNYIEAMECIIETEQMRLELVAKVEADAPKVEAFDTFIDSRAWQTIGEVAKVMDKGRNGTYDALREEGFLIQRGMDKNLPLQKYIDSGHFAVKESTVRNKYGQWITRSRTLVSPKGVELIRRILARREFTA
ncbi:BRO family protein [Heliophilum fasciatum]|uniref:Prophage antirepressor-like protein n=1 Tax=Heliophilum fasciatum TaxID=35700 RepID=A0A4R2RCV2_9FIRM|nr:phage antirepressor [Heliophilum fasciatum]MCW2279122.1 prophage antirepressor-like protein [Heliophilum fasciatum]TCP61250.1 prophage antirepressor-like protein [Heliophilum fasciatum]